LLEKYLIMRSEHAKVYFFVVSFYQLFVIICNSSIFHFHWRQFGKICGIFSWFIYFCLMEAPGPFWKLKFLVKNLLSPFSIAYNFADIQNSLMKITSIDSFILRLNKSVHIWCQFVVTILHFRISQTAIFIFRRKKNPKKLQKIKFCLIF
jgi:hypothetical protein